MAKVLTSRLVETQKPAPKKRLEIPDGALPGLYLIVQTSGRKSWAVRYRVGGRPKKLTLGPAIARRSTEAMTAPKIGEPMTLAEAREKAREALGAVSEGADPGAAKKASQGALERDTVEAVSKKFIVAQKRINRTGAETERAFRKEVWPVIGKKDLAAVTRRDAAKVVDGVFDRGAPAMANRLHANLRRFFEWAVERGYRDDNPMQGMRKPHRQASRERVLSDEEIGLIWHAADRCGYPYEGIVKLLILTGQRRNEIAGLTRSEIVAGKAPRLELPGDRTKNGRPHSVPVAPLALEVLKATPRLPSTDFVFTTTGRAAVSGWSRFKDRLDRLVGDVQADQARERGEDTDDLRALEAWTLHDLRRTAATGMARLGVDLPVVERILNHVSGSFGGVVGVYQRHDFEDEKRAALNLWAEHVARIVARDAAGKAAA